MDPQLQEIAKQIADVVEKRLSKRFDSIDERFDGVDERFNAVDQRFNAVDERFNAVGERLDAVDERLGAVEERLGAADERLGAVDERLGEVDKRLDAAGKRSDLFGKRFDSFEARIDQKLRVHLEQTAEIVRLAAEGYGATLASIDRRLDRLQDKVVSGFADHAKVLREHTLQINALKRQQAKRRSVRR